MKRSIGCGLATLLIAVGLGLAGDEVTLQGQFVWNSIDGETTGDLKAVFTPTGKDEWNVAFHFDFQDQANVYKGTAQGSLSDGSLEGEVDDGDEGENKRTYRFRGTFANRAFAGTHARVSTEGEPRDLGTLTLRSAD